VSLAPHLAEGDRVIFLRTSSTWTSHATVRADRLFKIPAEVDSLQAAMLKTNPATAWRLLHGFAALTHADTVVQNLGGSSVAHCVVQLSRELGIRTVSFVRRADQIEELLRLGATHVFVDDEGGCQAAASALGGATAALAFNGVGGDSALRLTTLLREGGTHITYGAMGRQPLSVSNRLLIFRDIRMRGLWISQWATQADAEEVETVYANLAQRLAAGSLTQRVDSMFPLEAWSDALARLAAPDRRGRVLFTP
jgi:NADPH:quinone reductase-like Zn-dependent oxidoreductase